MHNFEWRDQSSAASKHVPPKQKGTPACERLKHHVRAGNGTDTGADIGRFFPKGPKRELSSLMN